MGLHGSKGLNGGIILKYEIDDAIVLKQGILDDRIILKG